MNQSEIKELREKYLDQIQTLQEDIDVLRARIGALVKRCKHPHKYQTSAMGDIGEHCPDCGWTR